MTASYSPVAHWKFWTQGGVPVPAAGYQLWFYQRGTTTLQAAFTDTTGTVPCPNPLILDTNGECTFCLDDSLAYKLLLTDAANGPSTPGNPEAGWPVDDVESGTLSALTAIKALLLNATIVTDGAGMISFYPLLSYPANTVGNALKAAASTTQIQNNSVTYFVSSFDVAGIPAYKLTPSPAILGYVVGQQFLMHAHATGVTGYNTLNINGLGAWPLIYEDQFGNQQPAQILSQIDYQVEYLGSQFRVLNPLPPTGNVVRGEIKNLQIIYPGSASATATADEIILKNAGGDAQIITGYNQTFNMTASGAGGLDTGVPGTGTYFLHAIWGPATNATNGTPIVNIIASASSLAPTFPAFYTHSACLGCFQTDSINHFPYPARQVGRKLTFQPGPGTNLANFPIVALPVGASSITAPTYIPLALTTMSPSPGFPPNGVVTWDLALRGSGTGQTMISSNTATSVPTGPYNSVTDPPEFLSGPNGGISVTRFSMNLSSQNIQYATTDAGAYLMALGWTYPDPA